jgi:hypothetical protein
MKRPVILNYGMGVDSTAMLVGLQQRGQKPDLIIFADTGGEKPETYAYLPIISAWLASHGWPEVTVVSYRPTRAPYDNLYDNCIINETLPSIAFRGGTSFDGGCSLKFKGEVMDAWIIGKSRGPWQFHGWSPFYAAHAVEGIQPLKAQLKIRRSLIAELKADIKKKSDSSADLKDGLAQVEAEALKVYKELAPQLPVKLIGFDDSEADRKRTVKAARRVNDNYAFAYPLQDWGWTRERCIEEIAAAGLPIPLKSACFFCPASKKWEIRWLAAVHPELFLRAVAMEDRAAAGRHGLGEKRGLGINFRWRAFGETKGFLSGSEVIGDRKVLLAQALSDKPAYEARDIRCEDICSDSTDELIQL